MRKSRAAFGHTTLPPILAASDAIRHSRRDDRRPAVDAKWYRIGRRGRQDRAGQPHPTWSARDRRNISLGYHLVDLQQAKMSERQMMSLFGEMDCFADRLPSGVSFAGDCQIEFRQLQAVRHPDLTKEQWLDLFMLWGEHYKDRLRAKREAKQARVAALCEERRSLFVARAFMPPSAARTADEQLARIGQEIAAHYAPSELQPRAAFWVSSSE